MGFRFHHLQVKLDNENPYTIWESTTVSINEKTDQLKEYSQMLVKTDNLACAIKQSRPILLWMFTKTLYLPSRFVMVGVNANIYPKRDSHSIPVQYTAISIRDQLLHSQDDLLNLIHLQGWYLMILCNIANFRPADQLVWEESANKEATVHQLMRFIMKLKWVPG